MLERTLILALTLLPLPPSLSSATDLDPERVEYLGYFRAPDEHKGWDGGLDHLSKCLGFPDPSPDDGYPGCLAVGVRGGSFLAVIDAVPPDRTGKPRAAIGVPASVFGMWPLYVEPDPSKGNAHPYHPNKWTCGIAKIPQELADEFSVSWLPAPGEL